MNNHAISRMQGELNCILAKYILENLKIDEFESEFIRKIVFNIFLKI